MWKRRCVQKMCWTLQILVRMTWLLLFFQSVYFLVLELSAPCLRALFFLTYSMGVYACEINVVCTHVRSMCVCESATPTRNKICNFFAIILCLPLCLNIYMILCVCVFPVLLAIFSHRFMGIAEQMGHTLERTSISTNIRERRDFSCAIFDVGFNCPTCHLSFDFFSHGSSFVPFR